ncbi:MAG TPA: phosphoribosylformylglycinamidine synthase subunit PurS [Longimicrobiales bacterium]
MNDYQVEVRVTPRAGLLDPQGKAIAGALHSLGFDGVANARVGRLIRMDVRAADEKAARASVDEMCRKLLANPVTEDYDVEVLDGARA